MSEVAVSTQNQVQEVTYNTFGGTVTLNQEMVQKYLKHGNKDLTDREIILFMNLCKYQKLNPFLNEAYAIKFGDTFSMVVGYQTYLRRAEENPDYLTMESGLIVQRGNDIVKKEGSCPYPGEVIIGGWCTVHRLRHEREVTISKEVSMSEYSTGQSNWRTKPAMMIEKVAISQALRSAFPKDYEGLYTEEEMDKTIQESRSKEAPISGDAVVATQEAQEASPAEVDELVSKSDKKALLDALKTHYGQDGVQKYLRMILDVKGIETSNEMTHEYCVNIIARIKADPEKFAADLEKVAADLQTLKQ